MGFLVDGGGGGAFGATKSEMEQGGQGCELNPRAWSRGRLAVRGSRACTHLVLCPAGQFVGPPTTWPLKCC